MGLKKIIEKWNTQQTNEYWKSVQYYIDEKTWKVHVVYDGFKDLEARIEGANNDDTRTLIFDIADIFTEEQMDEIKKKIYIESIKSMPEYGTRLNEDGENEQYIQNELNPFVDAEEA